MVPGEGGILDQGIHNFFHFSHPLIYSVFSLTVRVFLTPKFLRISLPYGEQNFNLIFYSLKYANFPLTLD